MRFLNLLILTILLAGNAVAEPEVHLEWNDVEKTNLALRLKGPDAELDSCLQSGADMLYRIELKRCRQYKLLWRECTEEVVETHNLKFDSINQTYNLKFDRFRDGAEPYTEIFKNRHAAIRALRGIKSIPAEYMSFNKESKLADNEYILVRAYSRCSVRGSKTLNRLSNFLTLGLVRFYGFDTGWRQYNFDN